MIPEINTIIRRNSDMQEETDMNFRTLDPNLPNEQKPKRRFLWRGVALVVGSFLLGGFILPNIRIGWKEPESKADNSSGLAVRPGAPTPLAENEPYAKAAQIASPAIVNIDTQQRVAPSLMDEEWFSGREPSSRLKTIEGSGVIIDKEGDILTNEHVVGPANEAGKKITVTLNDGTGRKLQGTVIGADHTTDVALVRISGANLPVSRIGTVKGLIPGQMAVAIGNPLGFRFTVTHGVVSALGRPINDQEEGRVYENLIQTDCAINPGNSGGALVDLQGKVIGINTIVATRAQGIGFAIPIDTALRVADELKRFGRIKRPWLGIVVLTNSPQLANNYDLPNVRGVVVSGIYRRGPAAKSDIIQGDVITSINDTPIHSDDELKAVEKKLKIGETVNLQLRRGEQTGKGKLMVGEAP